MLRSVRLVSNRWMPELWGKSEAVRLKRTAFKQLLGSVQGTAASRDAIMMNPDDARGLHLSSVR